MSNDDEWKIRQRDVILKTVGSTSFYDAIFLFVFPPIAILALIGNIISYRILTARYFQRKPLYTYLRVCCLNSSIINLVFAITFVCDSRRYLAMSNSQAATYFRCYFKIPILNTCYFYGSVLDIVVGLDRLVEFTRFKATFRRLNAHVACSTLAVVCVLLNVPYLFVFEPRQREYVLVEPNTARNQTETLFFYGESKLALSREGRIFKYIQIVLRELVTLLVMIAINIATLILLK